MKSIPEVCNYCNLKIQDAPAHYSNTSIVNRYIYWLALACDYPHTKFLKDRLQRAIIRDKSLGNEDTPWAIDTKNIFNFIVDEDNDENT